MSVTANLLAIVADLSSKIESGDYNKHAVDVFNAIKDCITSSTPISQELQHAYVRIIANEQQQDRYGQ